MTPFELMGWAMAAVIVVLAIVVIFALIIALVQFVRKTNDERKKTPHNPAHPNERHFS